MKTSDGSSALDASVLVLNRMYVAVRVVTVRRAFVMLCRDSAEVIHVDNGAYANYDFETWCELSQFWCEDPSLLAGLDQSDWVRAVRYRIQAPRIIRLLRFDQTPRQTVRLNRRTLFARDGHCCQYCGKPYPHSQLSLDHVTPRSRGGTTCWENVVTCCLHCNSQKGNRTPQEAGMRLQMHPAKPKHNPMLKLQLGNPRYQVWQPFLHQAGYAIDVI
ncbi:MAG: HNH endonuclease [Candidatus Anammoximicrobium sp.]|nr:HNH endonuclease [Candidatus Anammoximicrobium sp.]